MKSRDAQFLHAGDRAALLTPASVSSAPAMSIHSADSSSGFAAVRRLRRVAVAIVAIAFLAAGGTKLLRPEPNVTLMSRYFPSPRAARAVACLEIALGLWLLSGRSPKLAPGVAAGTLAGLALMVGGELRRPDPLPCGCFPSRSTPRDTAATRRELSVAVGRNVFLALLCGVALATAERDEAEDGVDRVA